VKKSDPHYQLKRSSKMNLKSFLEQSAELFEFGGINDFASSWTSMSFEKGGRILEQGQPETGEFVLLRGALTSSICDQDGKEVCVAFDVGPSVVAPNIARTRNGSSLVTMVATSDVTLARIDAELLASLMIASEPIRNWGNGVLRDALGQKVDREWCLAALGGAERLSWFRQAFPDYESIFKHTLIASYLGITPVTMSRLRANDRRN
jgi:CRP-like cAMP-binding protein